MVRPFAVLLAAILAGAACARAEAQTWPWDFHPAPLFGPDAYDDGRVWRHYPPHYGAEAGPEIIGAAVGGFVTNPCFLGGCHYYHGDLAYAASWGRPYTNRDSSQAAFRAVARLADKAATSSVMVEPGPTRARHRAHKERR
jgi:hypothetical protein